LDACRKEKIKTGRSILNFDGTKTNKNITLKEGKNMLLKSKKDNHY